MSYQYDLDDIGHDELREIHDTLRTLAEDLEAALSVDYPRRDREKFPALSRRWTRDMEPVHKADEICERLGKMLGDE